MTSLICLQEELEEVSLDMFSLRPPWEVCYMCSICSDSLKLGGEVGAMARDLGVAA